MRSPNLVAMVATKDTTAVAVEAKARTHRTTPTGPKWRDRRIENRDESGGTESTVSLPAKTGKADSALLVIGGRPMSLNFFERSTKTCERFRQVRFWMLGTIRSLVLSAGSWSLLMRQRGCVAMRKLWISGLRPNSRLVARREMNCDELCRD